MGLRDYQEPFAEIQAKTATGTKPLAVFGLTLEQAVFLARDYGEHIAPIYTEARENGLTEDRTAQIMAELLTEAPAVINMICYFALRCESEEDMDTVARMPVGLRIEIVETAAKLTFHSENGPGKVMGIVVNTFREAMGMAAQNAGKIKAARKR